MYYGVDLHSGSFQAAVLGEGQDGVRLFKCGLDRESLRGFLERLTQQDHVAVEASTNTFWFVDQIRELVREVHVVDPLKFSIIGNANKKTDRVDAEKLAKKMKYYVEYDRSGEEFPTVFIPPKEARELRTIFTTYQIVKKERNMLKNRVRSLLRQNAVLGLEKRNLSEGKCQRDVLAAEMPESVRAQIRLLFQLIGVQEEAMEGLTRQVLVQARCFRVEMELLMSIKGVSAFIAAAIMADVVDIRRFPNAKHFCSYLRAAPRIEASGNTTRVGQTNKHSRKLSMSLLVECLNHFRNSNERLDRFYVRKCRGKSRGKVRVAVVRKMLVAMYYMLKNGTLYHHMEESNYKNKLKGYENLLKKAA